MAGTAPGGAIVALIPAAGEAPMPEGPAVMDQYSKTFVPNVVYVRVGQPVEFRNSEDMPHNVNVTRRGSGTAIFSVATEPQQKYVHAFDRAVAQVGRANHVRQLHQVPVLFPPNRVVEPRTGDRPRNEGLCERAFVD